MTDERGLGCVKVTAMWCQLELYGIAHVVPPSGEILIFRDATARVTFYRKDVLQIEIVAPMLTAIRFVVALSAEKILECLDQVPMLGIPGFDRDTERPSTFNCDLVTDGDRETFVLRIALPNLDEWPKNMEDNLSLLEKSGPPLKCTGLQCEPNAIRLLHDYVTGYTSPETQAKFAPYAIVPAGKGGFAPVDP